MSIELQFKKRNGKIVSSVRRITEVYPLDSPAMALVFRWNPADTHETRMGVLELLKGYGATASFVITGDVADHDADFVKQALGAEFELINGGYSARPFSAKGLKAPADVVQLNGYESALRDVSKLHEVVKEDFEYEMKAGMPAYGVEYIEPAISIYDLYDIMDYQYIYGSDIIAKGQEAKLAEALKAGGLNGHVAVLDICEPGVLKAQLDTLADAGYGVCSVAELLAVSPFRDIGANDPAFDAAKRLVDAGRPIAMRNNCVTTRPFEIIGDTLTTILPKDVRMTKVPHIRDHKTMMGKYSVYNPYCAVIYWARNKANRVKFDFPTTSGLFRRVMHDAGFPVDIGKYRVQYRRGEIIRIMADILCATEDQDPYGVFQEHLTPLQYDLKEAIGEEEFNKIKAEVDARHAAEAEAEANGGKKEEPKEEEKGTILDRYDQKRKDKKNGMEVVDQFGHVVERYSEEEPAEEEEIPETNKDQIVL